MKVQSKRVRTAAVLLLSIYWVALFVGTHAPIQLGGGQGNDKVLHLAAYAGLSFLFIAVLAATWSRFRLLFVSFAVVAAYAAIDELLQLPIPGRDGDLWDWLADITGAALGLVAYLLVRAVLQQVFSPAATVGSQESSVAATSGD